MAAWGGVGCLGGIREEGRERVVGRWGKKRGLEEKRGSRRNQSEEKREKREEGITFFQSTFEVERGN